MKHKYAFLSSLFMLALSTSLFAQTTIERPLGFTNASELGTCETLTLSGTSFEELMARADQLEATKGQTINGRVIFHDANTSNFGTWTELSDGTKVWRATLHSPEAMSVCAYFDGFYLPEGSAMFIYNADRTYFEGPITSEENNDHMRFMTNDMWGESITIEYVQPADVVGEAVLDLMGAGHFFRMVYPPSELADAERGGSAAGSCQVNVNCPEGEFWTKERDGVVRMRITDGNDIGLCSGSLVNTTAFDCRQYVLSAMHCAPTVSDADMAFLQFRFNYERPAADANDDGIPEWEECGTAGFSSARNRTGAIRLADSNDDSPNGFNGSDFLLLEVEDDIPDSYNPYFAGWDANNTTSPSGKGIHHPSGDIKKISEYTQPAQSIWWGAPGSHWEVRWSATETNHGTTEGGSSGSPLYNEQHKIIGTLSSGFSDCVQSGQFGPNAPDQYGKMSYHWDNNQNSADQKLKVWLDPVGTTSGVETLVLDGAYRNGEGSCNPALSTEEYTLGYESFFIAPNPSSDFLNLRIKSSSINHTVLVFDQTGKLVAEELISGPVARIALSELPAGIYYITLQDENGLSQTKKWSKI
jgi:hypothetical protein